MALLGAPLFFLGLLGYERLAQRVIGPPVLAQHDRGPKSDEGSLLRSIYRPAQSCMPSSIAWRPNSQPTVFMSTRGKTYAQLKSLLREQGVQDELTDGQNELETQILPDLRWIMSGMWPNLWGS